MAEAEQTRTFTVTVKSTDGNCEKIVQELVNRCLGKDKEEKQKSCSCKCGKDKKLEKREQKCVKTHKAEAYVKPEVDKRICRDIYCKTHYIKPIVKPLPSNGNLQRPPFLPPPYMGSYDSRDTIIFPPTSYGHLQQPAFMPPPYMGSYDSMYPRPPLPYGDPTYRLGW